MSPRPQWLYSGWSSKDEMMLPQPWKNIRRPKPPSAQIQTIE
ncbi:hypothetical protein AAIH32_04615 [Pseudarthrobacter oxydans]